MFLARRGVAGKYSTEIRTITCGLALASCTVTAEGELQPGVIEPALEIFHEHLMAELHSLLGLLSTTDGQGDITPSLIVLGADRGVVSTGKSMRISNASTISQLFGIVALLAACTTCRSSHQTPALTRDPLSVSQPPANDRQSRSLKEIRSVDFANFTFPWPRALRDSKKTFTLRGRELNPTRGKTGMVEEMGVILESITYGDVTCDGTEEAMVILSIVTGGSAVPHAAYVYALKDGKTKLLWAISTGDRADGGLRRIAAENGDLVIELFGVGTAIGKKLYGTEDVGACCPKHFTRTRYKWVGNQFRQDGPEEVFENPSGSAAPVTFATPPPL